jgi:hypothetical protein
MCGLLCFCHKITCNNDLVASDDAVCAVHVAQQKKCPREKGSHEASITHLFTPTASCMQMQSDRRLQELRAGMSVGHREREKIARVVCDGINQSRSPCFAQEVRTKKTECKWCEETRESTCGWGDNLLQPTEERKIHLE